MSHDKLRLAVVWFYLDWIRNNTTAARSLNVHFSAQSNCCLIDNILATTRFMTIRVKIFFSDNMFKKIKTV